MSEDCPCPGDDSEVFRITDEGIGSYIEFPPDTIFLESMAGNETFAPGVGYIVAQRKTGPDGQPESWVYEIRPGMEEAKELFGPLATEGEGTETTIFGSALTSDGILYLCCFNRNSLITYDLNNPPEPGLPALCNLEIPDLPSPNDMCFDPKDEKILYVCGGTFRNFIGATFTNSAYGQVFKVTVTQDNTGAEVETIKKDLDTLAGIEVIGNDVWVAELFDVFSLDQTKGHEKTIRWKGNDGCGAVWLADNIDTFDLGEDEKLILSPAYSTVPESTVDNIMQRNCAMSMVLFGYQVLTAVSKGEDIREALEDPEVSLGFSNTFIKEDDVDPAPIRILMMKPDGSKCYHFEVDLVQTRADHDPWEPEPEEKPGQMRYFFNEQVTHSSHLKSEDGGYIVCVNFEEPRVLLLKDDKFKECIAKKNAE